MLLGVILFYLEKKDPSLKMTSMIGNGFKDLVAFSWFKTHGDFNRIISLLTSLWRLTGTVVDSIIAV